jgi:hypothetical protein
MAKDDDIRGITKRVKKWGELFQSGAEGSVLSAFAERIAVWWGHLARRSGDA